MPYSAILHHTLVNWRPSLSDHVCHHGRNIFPALSVDWRAIGETLMRSLIGAHLGAFALMELPAGMSKPTGRSLVEANIGTYLEVYPDVSCFPGRMEAAVLFSLSKLVYIFRVADNQIEPLAICCSAFAAVSN